MTALDQHQIFSIKDPNFSVGSAVLRLPDNGGLLCIIYKKRYEIP